MTTLSGVRKVHLELFAAGHIMEKCIAQCLITFYYDEPRVTTTVAIIEVPCDIVDNDELLREYIKSLENTAITRGIEFLEYGI